MILVLFKLVKKINNYINILPIMAVYHDKAKTEPLLKHTLLAIDRPKDEKFDKVYTQSWTNIILILLQRPKNIQTIIDTLIYNHASNCLSNRIYLF